MNRNEENMRKRLIDEAREKFEAIFGQYSNLCEDEALKNEWMERYVGFLEGTKTLPLTYDPVFKKIFDMEEHKERLEAFISSLIGIKVKVIGILQPGHRFTAEHSLVIMDLVVELEDGSVTNLEIQKVPYSFPPERASCYSADLLMRQYTRLKARKGKKFRYSDLKKVYTIVIFEKSNNKLKTKEGNYIYHGKTVFDNELKVDMLQEYIFVTLDEFIRIGYPKDDSERTGWLSLLATNEVKKAQELVEIFPWLKEIYEEMSRYKTQPMEVMSMFSEILAELDRNTVRDMVEEQQEEINRLNEQLVREHLEMKQKKNETIKNSYALYKKMGMDEEKAIQTVSEVFGIETDEARKCVRE